MNFVLPPVLLLVGTLVLPVAIAGKLPGVVGWAEPVVLHDYGINLRAKLDTGAENSSLNSQRIEIIEKDGRQMVHFDIRSREGKITAVELPLERETTIRRHFGKSQTRPVVKLKVCLAHQAKTIEVNLVDRSGFEYQMLLGRSFLAPDFLIDSSQTLTTRPACDSSDVRTSFETSSD